MITATFPSDSNKNLSNLLRATVLNAKWNKDQDIDPFKNLKFRITASGQMKYATRFGNYLFYTSGGVFPVRSPKDPYFIVHEAESYVRAEERKQYAEKRLFQFQKLQKM